MLADRLDAVPVPNYDLTPLRMAVSESPDMAEEIRRCFDFIKRNSGGYIGFPYWPKDTNLNGVMRLLEMERKRRKMEGRSPEEARAISEKMQEIKTYVETLLSNNAADTDDATPIPLSDLLPTYQTWYDRGLYFRLIQQLAKIPREHLLGMQKYNALRSLLVCSYGHIGEHQEVIALAKPLSPSMLDLQERMALAVALREQYRVEEIFFPPLFTEEEIRNKPFVLKLVAKLAVMANRFDLVKPYFEKPAGDPGVDKYYLLAQLEQPARDMQTLESLLLYLKPSLPSWFLVLLCSRLNRFHLYIMTIMTLKDHPGVLQSKKLSTLLGRAYIETRQPEKAIPFFENRLGRHDSIGRICLSQAYRKAGQADKAKKLFETHALRTPYEVIEYVGVLKVLERFDEATEVFDNHHFHDASFLTAKAAFFLTRLDGARLQAMVQDKSFSSLVNPDVRKRVWRFFRKEALPETGDLEVPRVALAKPTFKKAEVLDKK